MGHLGDDFFAVTLPSLNLKSSQFELYSNVVIIYNVDSEEIENVFESMVESPVGKTEKQEYSIDKKIPDKESAWDVIYDGLLRPGTLEGEQGFNKLVKLGKGILIQAPQIDRKSTRLNSSHVAISYAVFCLKKKKKKKI